MLTVGGPGQVPAHPLEDGGRGGRPVDPVPGEGQQGVLDQVGPCWHRAVQTRERRKRGGIAFGPAGHHPDYGRGIGLVRRGFLVGPEASGLQPGQGLVVHALDRAAKLVPGTSRPCKEALTPLGRPHRGGRLDHHEEAVWPRGVGLVFSRCKRIRGRLGGLEVLGVGRRDVVVHKGGGAGPTGGCVGHEREILRQDDGALGPVVWPPRGLGGRV